MRQSTFTPTVLLVSGVLGALWCLDGFLVRGDLAWKEAVQWFAIASLFAAIGAQELMTTELHESDERSGF